MRDYLFVVFLIFLMTAIIYMTYKILWGIEKNPKELQITENEIIEQIKILIRQKKHDIAERLAKNYLRNKPTCHEVRYLLAKAFYELGNFADAISQIKYVIKFQPKVADNKILLATCYRTVKRPDKAIDTLAEVLDLEPENTRVIKNMAVLYMETNQKFAAIKMYEKLADILDDEAKKVEIKMILADLYSSVNDIKNALRHYKDILNIFPDDILTKMALCELYQKAENYESAINTANEIYTTALVEKDNLWALYKLLEIYRITGQFERALDVAKRINVSPLSDKVKARDDIAQILVELGRNEEGISIWNDLIDEVPNNISLKKNLATAYLREHDYETAITMYKKLTEEVQSYDIPDLNSEISTLYADWGMYLFEQGDQENCFKKFTTALQYNSENPIIYWKLGSVDKAIRSYKEALTNFKKAIDLDPTQAKYYCAIAECYEALDSIYEQKKYLSESLKYDDFNADVHYKLGVNYQKQNDLNAAIYHMKRATIINKNFVDAKLKLALMYEHKGKVEDAVALYEDVLRIDPENETAINNLHMLEA